MNKFMEAFKYNLDAYENKTIDKDEFTQAMEEHYLHYSMPEVRRETLVVVERIKEEIIDDYKTDLPKDWYSLCDEVDETEYYADYLTDLSFTVAHYIQDRLDDWSKFEHLKKKQ